MIDFTFLHRPLVSAIVFAGCLTAVAAEGSIGFAVSDVSAMDATVSVTPSSDELAYYWNFMDKETFLANGGVDKAIDNRIEVWKRNASYYDNTTWQEMMGYDLQYGPQTRSISDRFGDTLMYDTEYVVYGFGMDPEGNVTAPVATAEFTTLMPPASDNAFEIEVTSVVKDKFYYTASAHVVPSNGDRYMVRFYTKDYVDSFNITPGSSGEKRFISEAMLYYPTSEMMASGPHDFSYTRCREGEPYYVVAMGINDDMTPSTSLTMAEFTAVETVAPPTGSIELEVSDITPMNARIRITPSDNEMYYYYYISSPEIIEEKGGIDCIPEKMIIDWWKYLAEIYGGSTKWQDFIPLQCNQGPLDDTVAHLAELGELEDIYWNSDWALYAVGFDLDGNVLTKPAVVEFTTPDCGESDMTFEYEFVSAELDTNYPNTGRKYYVVTVDIYPSNDEETFRACYMQMKYYDQYYDTPEDMFDFITRQFLPSSVEFSGPVRLRMPGVPATDVLGNELEWGIFTIGWNEGPTTDISIYEFNLATTGVESATAESVKVKAANGRLTIEGDYESAAVYSLDGSVAGGLMPGHSLTLTDGVYVVKYITSDGTQHTRKIIVK